MSIKSNRFLFLGGSPKCGTTYLFNLLNYHPELNVSKKKEAYFFLDKDHTGINKKINVYKNGVHRFLEYFDKEGEACCLEATSHMIYQNNISDYIKTLGDVKLIFILRNPIKRIISTFEFTKNNLGNVKDDPSFTLNTYVDILLKEDHELLNDWLRNSDGDYVFKRELEYCNYYPFIEYWTKEIGASNIKVIQFEDFLQKKTEYLEDIQNWAKLIVVNLLELGEEKKNEAVAIKITWLHHQSIKLAKHLPSSRFKSRVKKLYFFLQKSKSRKGELDEHSIKRLNDYFKHSNETLAKKFAFDLNKWKN